MSRVTKDRSVYVNQSLSQIQAVSDEPRRQGLSSILALFLGAGIGWQMQTYSYNVQPVDALLVLLVFLAVVRWTLHMDSGAWLLVRTLPWLWLMALGSLVGLATAGLPTYGIVAVTRDAFTFSLLFATLAWLGKNQRRAEALLVGMTLLALVCAFLIIASGEPRPSGTFRNPNLAAHFLATVLLLVLTRWHSVLLGLPFAVVILYAIIRSGSFGALVMLAAAIIYWLTCRAPFAARIRRLVVVVLISLLALLTIEFAQEDDFLQNSQFSGSRYDRSSITRYEAWQGGLKILLEQPLGVGPASVSNEALVLNRNLELHNEPLAYLVERGPLGLLGLVGFVTVIWISSRPGGAVRILLTAFTAASLFRETLNYRHLWIALAVAFVLDQQQQQLWHRPELPSAANGGDASQTEGRTILGSRSR